MEILVKNSRVSGEGCWGQLKCKENEDESERSFFRTVNHHHARGKT